MSAVIATYQRPGACERALRSVLAQEPAPLEVLVCDDGSSDDTAERFTGWERRDERVRYVRVEPNRGTPGPARNAGVAAARGDWIAFLDDDDEWLPGKLAAQLEHSGDADVVATNAERASGGAYFARPPAVLRPERADLLRDNPLIVSSAMARRSLIASTPGFIEERWARGVADYGMWLELADRGARFAVLGEVLVRYEDADESRMSAEVLKQESAVARLAWRRVRRNPRDPELLRAALNKTVAAALSSTRPRRPRRA